MSTKVAEITKKLKAMGNPKNVEGMAKFGIKPKKPPFGISTPQGRNLAKELKKEIKDPIKRHELALKLWKTGQYEARFIAALIDDPRLVTEDQMEEWVLTFDNWATCDTTCGELFDKTPFAYKKALEWTKRNEEYVKRAGFTIAAWLAVHDKKAEDKMFYPFFGAIKKEAKDERIYVKKAVNWALRQIGKSRTKNLYKLALETANDLKKIDSKSSRWIVSDALRELLSENIVKRINAKK